MSKRCWGENRRAICYCDIDFCNGDFHNLLYKWITTSVANTTLFNCVKDHIWKKESIPTPEPPREGPIASTPPVAPPPHLGPLTTKTSPKPLLLKTTTIPNSTGTTAGAGKLANITATTRIAQNSTIQPTVHDKQLNQKGELSMCSIKREGAVEGDRKAVANV
ncbi:hypothetical protein Y032_0906g2973 [Ancylostoma ceylanicum]|uniref:Uncharacterized protein n=2 Tax=Ancylostoma ceylanicum TaxID=53326 RepID=A0A016W927_9BILA|nr:hypothetical protein Y032_0906g2973 [Ancylostoma ceylanicum]